MRRLNRKNKEKSQKYVQEGGFKVVSEIKEAHYQNFHMKFLYTYEEWIKLEEEHKKHGIWMLIIKRGE